MNELEYRRALKALPREIQPDRNLWPGIAAKLGQQQLPLSTNHQRRLRITAAASLAGAMLVLGWQILSQSSSFSHFQLSEQEKPKTSWILHEASYMKANVDAALIAGAAIHPKQLESRSDEGFRSTFNELEIAQRDLDQALKQHPESIFLLDRMRHLQQQRIRLTHHALST